MTPVGVHPPSGERDPELDFMNDDDLSDVGEPAEPPNFTRLQLPKGVSLGAPLSNIIQSSSSSKPPSGSVTDRPRKTLQYRPSAVAPFNDTANKEAAKRGKLLPQLTQLNSVPMLLPLESFSSRSPDKPDAVVPTAPASTPTQVVTATPPSDRYTGSSQTPSRRRIINSGVRLVGGSNKKRTRKHKKHTSISASRRPTRRRRRIPPTEGHKYTRKRPRT